jgi:hypothetical protein
MEDGSGLVYLSLVALHRHGSYMQQACLFGAATLAQAENASQPQLVTFAWNGGLAVVSLSHSTLERQRSKDRHHTAY